MIGTKLYVSRSHRVCITQHLENNAATCKNIILLPLSCLLNCFTISNVYVITRGGGGAQQEKAKQKKD